jgi:DNA repair protein SbcD/Mre11
VRFLHAADVHLDSPLQGLAAREDLPAEHIRHCTRRAFSKLIDLCLEEDAAFLILAGDLYDGDWKDLSTGRFLAAELRRLGRPCYLVRGNHDARSVITRSLPMPANLHEFPEERAGTFLLEGARVALHGRSFATRTTTEDLSASYPPPVPGFLNIGVLHSSAEERGEHETYAPCSVQALALAGYDYWALGHIHERRVLSERPWIVFPGNLQGRHARETGAKGASVVTVQGNAIARVEHRPLDVLRWARLEVDATGASAPELTARIEAAARAAVAEAEDRPLFARLVVTGETALHARLTMEPEQAGNEAMNAAGAAGGALWIETVRVATRAPQAAPGEALAALEAAFADAARDPALRARLLEEFRRLRLRLPQPVRAAAALPEEDAGLDALVEQALGLALAEAASAR